VVAWPPAVSGHGHDDVTYSDARLVRWRTVQPDGPTIWFAFRKERSQNLALVQFIEPGTLRAHVHATFGTRSCQPYLPPRLGVQLHPR